MSRHCRMPSARRGLAFAAAALLLVAAGSAQARVGDTRTTIFVGTTTFSDGEETSSGTTVGAVWALEFQEDLEWTVGGSYAATQGEADTDGGTTDISTTTTRVDTGLRALFNREPGSNLVAFVGGGVSLLSYDIDYDYPDSEVGDTSGVGPGLFASVGAEIRLTRRVWFIPSLDYSVFRIETEDGDAFTATSSGLTVSIRIGF